MKRILIVLALIMLLVLPASAWTETFEHSQLYDDVQTTGSHTYSGGDRQCTHFYIPVIENYVDISEYFLNPDEAEDFYFDGSAALSNTFTMKIGTDVIATGQAFIESGDNENIRIVFTSFDRGAYTGAQTLTIYWTNNYRLHSTLSKGVDAGTMTAPALDVGDSAPYYPYEGYHDTSYETEYKAILSGETGTGVEVTTLNLTRVIGGLAYNSSWDVRSGVYVYIDDTYGITNDTIDVTVYPVDVTITFGDPPLKTYHRLITAYNEIPIDSSGTYYLGVNIWEQYSNAILMNQPVTVTNYITGDNETLTSTFGQTLYFAVTPGLTYWINATRAGYENYNETYLIPNPPGIYPLYMTKQLPAYPGMNYTHFSVIDMTNGGLVPNAAITISDGQSKLSNAAGYAWFLVNSSTPYTYTVTKTGYYIPVTGAFNITADTKIVVAMQRSPGPTPTWTYPSWTPVTVPTTSGGGSGTVVPTLSAALRAQNVQEGMDVWYLNLPFISQFLFLLFIIGGLGLMAGGKRN
jgi:hypothetical protein